MSKAKGADESFLETNEDELNALAKAIADPKAADIAAAGAALMTKILTGSSILASAAEKAAAKAFGKWLADNPDTRLQQAAAAFAESDRRRRSLQQFASLIEPITVRGLRSVESSVARIECDQRELSLIVATRADDLEALIEQSLRSAAQLKAEQAELKSLLVQVQKLLQASATRPSPVTQTTAWNVPFRSSRFFVGRDELLELLDDALQPNRSGLVVVSGLGGIGKTQLAVEYAFCSQSNYESVLWVSAESPEALHANLAALSGENALRLPERDEADQAIRLDAVVRWLAEHSKWLLVLDNVDSEEAVNATVRLVQPLVAGHVLITARRSQWPADFRVLEVQKLPHEVAAAFLIERTTQKHKASLGSPDEALAIARELDGLPLALEQAAAYMLHKRTRFSDYQSKLKDVLRYELKGGTADQKSVFTTWSVTYEALSLEARVVLRLVCWLSADAIPRELLLGDDGAAFRDAMRVMGAEAKLEAADTRDVVSNGILELAEYSMIDLESIEFSCHRLLAVVQREQIAEHERARWVCLVARIIDASTAYDTDDRSSVHIFSKMEQHLLVSSVHADDFGLAELARVLMSRCASFFTSQARFREAEPLMRRALAIGELTDGEDHPTVATDLIGLARLLQETNQLQEAEEQMRRALAIDELTYGEHHPSVARDLSSLARLLQETNHLDESEQLMRRALDIHETSFAPDDLHVAESLNNLATLLQMKERYHEAEVCMHRALAIYQTACGTEHPRVATTMNNLAALLQDTGRLEEALSMMAKVLNIDMQSHGSQHLVAKSMSNLAAIMVRLNEFRDAEKMMRLVLETDRKMYGPKHPRVAIGLNNLALLMKAVGRLEEAEPLMRLSVEVYAGSYGDEHPDTVRAIRNLDSVMNASRRRRAAREEARRANLTIVALAAFAIVVLSLSGWATKMLTPP